MNHPWKIVSTESEFIEWLSQSVSKTYALDIETYGKHPFSEDSKIMGIAITRNRREDYDSIYIPIFAYNPASKLIKPKSEIREDTLRAFLTRNEFIGWNVAFDKSWLDIKFRVDTNWKADGRIYWHLQNNNEAIRGFGLKTAQKELLKWEVTNEDALKHHVAARGGKLENGDHYMADTDVLAYYACLDTYSTYQSYEKLEGFVRRNEYEQFAKNILNYSLLLRKSTLAGIKIDVSELKVAQEEFKVKREQFGKQLIEDFKHIIQPLEDRWLEEDLSAYKTLKGKAAFMQDKERHRRFNPGSSQQRIELLHNLLGLPVYERTEGGQPKTDRASLAALKHPAAQLLLFYSEYKKLYEMAGTYIENATNSRLYPSYDVCGTVSGRLAGFEPSVLNLPFSEESLMHAFKCDDGYVGVHADLAAIEPCVIAHYSGDEALLKVYRDGLGDIYLDLALELFPENKELKSAYNPNAKLDSTLKTRFSDLRSIAKTIHLAVSYTGSYITIGKNLNKSGFPTTEERARLLVSRYWKKFSKVADFNYRLKHVYDNNGTVRNLLGRVIKVPAKLKKDLMNRLIQSSAHDILVEWVMAINRIRLDRKIEMKPILPDVHDSTSWQVKEGQEAQAMMAFIEALKEVESKVQMTVPIKAEIKYFRTFAGLKGDE